MVFELLQIDRESRHLNVIDDLFTLDDIVYNKTWDYSVPTITRNENSFKRNKINYLTTSTFKERFTKKYPYLMHPTIDWNNLLVAGSSISEFFIDKPSNDIDIFVYGLSQEEADARIMEFFSSIEHVLNLIEFDKKMERYKQETSKNPNSKVQPPVFVKNEKLQCVKQNHVINIYTDDYNIQVVLRLYNTVSEILHGFDIGSSAVGFDGNTIYFTSLSKFSYEYMCNIVDVSRKSTTYEQRLYKYLERGFDIILPYFDISKLSTRLLDEYGIPEVCELPYLCFTYDYVYDNKIRISKIYYKRYEQEVSDYYDGLDITNKYTIYAYNLAQLTSNKNNPNIITYGNLREITDFNLDFSKIRYVYESTLEKILENNTFPTASVKKLFVSHSLEEVFSKRTNKVVLKQMIDIELKRIKDKLDTLDINKINWNIDGRMEQNLVIPPSSPLQLLTSSFHPVYLTNADWYGIYNKAQH